MTVKELIRVLSKMDLDRIVVVARDSEGNGFSPLAPLLKDSTAAYKDGEVGLEPEELTPELRKQGYTEEDVIEDGQKAVVLWPED